MSQLTITHYFGKRKRNGNEQTRSKVLALDIPSTGQESKSTNSILYQPDNTIKVVYPTSKKLDTIQVERPCLEEKISLPKRASNRCGSSEPKVKPKNPLKGKVPLKVSTSQTDIRRSFIQPTNCTLETVKTNSEIDHRESKKPEPKKRVVFEIKGSLSSPKSKAVEPRNSPNKVSKGLCLTTESVTANTVELASKSTAVKDVSNNVSENNSTGGAVKPGLMTPTKTASQDLSLSDLKSRLTRSARLAELRASLGILSKGAEQLKLLETRRQEIDAKIDANTPSLKKFDTFEIEVPVSSVPRSPYKKTEVKKQYKRSTPPCSPAKGPAFARFASLAVPEHARLSLPFNYSCLEETFHCVDAVTALIINRKETVTFKKLKPGVQEMLRRNFTEHHLGQIKRLYPDAYAFYQEKRKSFGSTAKSENYELVIKPLVAESSEQGQDNVDVTNAESCNVVMTSTCLVERKKRFHKLLLERVMVFHEEFLKSLEPPLLVPREELTRWHPEFDLDKVPDVEADVLPQPPDVAQYSSAKDVLDRAKTLFQCNTRMMNALEKVGGESSSSTHSESSTVSEQNKPFADMFKGIPKALLDKVRAKQAAKAMQIMTCSVTQEKECLRYARLPEIARIVRTLFIVEKKNVLPYHVVVQKIEDSYREKMSLAEIREHVQLLIKELPGWLTHLEIHLESYLRFSKQADMARVLKRLENLASKKNIF